MMPVTAKPDGTVEARRLPLEVGIYPTDEVPCPVCLRTFVEARPMMGQSLAACSRRAIGGDEQHGRCPGAALLLSFMDVTVAIPISPDQMTVLRRRDRSAREMMEELQLLGRALVKVNRAA